MPRICPRRWRRRRSFQLSHRQSQLHRKVTMKRALDLHHSGGMLGEHRQRFQGIGLGTSQAQDPGKVFEIQIVLSDEKLKRRTREGTLTNFSDEGVGIDRLPDSVGLLAYLLMELWSTHLPHPTRGGS